MKKQKSHYATPDSINREWVCINAENQILGRLASQIASILRGKTKPTFTPSVDVGDFVIVTNVEKLIVKGNNKETDKMYYRHSGYPGGLKEASFKELMEKKPEDVLYLAVKGMMPHNRIGRQMIKKLKIYKGNEHPHGAQNPKELTLS